MSELRDRLRIALGQKAKADETSSAVHEDIAALAGEGVIAAFSDGSYVWVPDTWKNPLRCIAETKKRTRCKNLVFGGQEYRWNEDGTVSYSSTAEEKIRRQVCSVHDDGVSRPGTEWFSI
jgi:hypothetical protein